MKRIIIGAIAFILVVSVAAAIYFTRGRNVDSPASNDNTAATTTSQQEETTSGNFTPEPQSTEIPEPSPSPAANEPEELDGDVLFSENIDLDGNGVIEKVEVVKVPVNGSTANEYEGTLVITSNGTREKAVFIKKPDMITGIYKSVEFQDIDGDGTTDVFIIIPDSGASFSLNYFYAYSYKLKKGLSFPGQEFGFDLAAFANGFKFEYKGDGILQASSSSYGFKGVIDLKDNSNYSPASEENNKAYERSWVDPTPVDLGSKSQLTLEKNEAGDFVIRVPLPVFGLATLDLIGEIDLLFSIDNSFKPRLNGFDFYDFNVDQKVKAGEYIKP